MELDSSQPKAKKEEENEIFWQIYRKVMVHLATPAPSSDHCTILIICLIMNKMFHFTLIFVKTQFYAAHITEKY